MTEIKTSKDFIRNIIDDDFAQGRYANQVHTRFPPEPNGYLHIGHAMSILLNYGIAEEYGGKFNLRFDDTNPTKEEIEYVESIIKDVKWLGADFEDRLLFASDYFDQLYEWAITLINKGKAYVDDQTADEIRVNRGTLTESGVESPFRVRSSDENLDLFKRMKAGEFKDGTHVLRAKIDMASPNINLRDPVMYRILHAHHHRTGNKWCIYPMYDWTHGQSDSIEGITHSICTLEFENNRPLYNWFIEQLGIFHPRQIEFAGLSLTYVVLSKRRLIRLVKEGYVNGWDDPRMPTISGLRRRGFTARGIRKFLETKGVAKSESIVDIALLEHEMRQDLNIHANRVMGVLNPLKVVIVNFPADYVEELEAINNPEDASQGTRVLPFSRELFIERDDFMEDPPKKFFRLAPGREVRLRYGYYITCVDVIKDSDGEIVELHCEYDPETKGGYAPDGRKVRGTIHWVSANHALNAEVRLYDRLFSKENPLDLEEGEDFTDYINPNSMVVLNHCKLEPSLATLKVGEYRQFERLGYFCLDPDSTDEHLVFNRTISLRDSWSKIKRKNKQ